MVWVRVATKILCAPSWYGRNAEAILRESIYSLRGDYAIGLAGMDSPFFHLSPAADTQGTVHVPARSICAHRRPNRDGVEAFVRGTGHGSTNLLRLLCCGHPCGLDKLLAVIRALQLPQSLPLLHENHSGTVR